MITCISPIFIYFCVCICVFFVFVFVSVFVAPRYSSNSERIIDRLSFCKNAMPVGLFNHLPPCHHLYFTCVCACICACIRTFICACICTLICACICAYICNCILPIFVTLTVFCLYLWHLHTIPKSSKGSKIIDRLSFCDNTMRVDLFNHSPCHH